MERSKQIMDALEALLREQGFDVQTDGRLDEHPGVNMLIPLQEDGTELVFAELHFITGPQGFDVIQLYTTLVGELQPQAAAETAKAIAVWNQDLLLGAFALRDDRQLYHRYCLTVPRSLAPGQAAALALDAFSFILGQIAEYHGDALLLASGTTFEALCAMD